jgi:hypothetical protein
MCGEGTGPTVVATGDANNLAILAEVYFAAPAKFAHSAVDGRVEGDAIARRD